MGYYEDFQKMIDEQYNGAIGNLDKLQEADRLQNAQEHDKYRNQASVNAARNSMALREQMAAQGLFNSGDNITSNMQIQNQRSADINAANLSESNAIAKMQQEKYRQMQELQMSRQDALRDAYGKSKEWDYRDSRDKLADERYQNEWNYNTGRDKLEDERWQKQWDYNVGRDNLTDQRWQKEWDYNVGRDNIEDGRWQKEWDYNTGRDKIEDGRYNSEWEYKKQQDALNQSNWERQFAKTGSSRGGGGGGGSYGYSPSGSTKDNVWNEFAQQFSRGIPADANVWLRNNKSDIVDAVGSSEYKKMQEEADRQQAEKIRNDRRKKNTSMFQS